MVRRAVAVIAGVIVFVLLIVLVKNCFDQRNKNAIKNYANDSAELLRASKVEGDGLFDLMQGKGGADQATSIINQLNGYRSESASLVDRANRLDVPGDLSDAQDELLSVLELRRDALAKVTGALRVALGDENRREGTTEVAKQMQVFLASDVIDTLRFRRNLFVAISVLIFLPIGSYLAGMEGVLWATAVSRVAALVALWPAARVHGILRLERELLVPVFLAVGYALGSGLSWLLSML